MKKNILSKFLFTALFLIHFLNSSISLAMDDFEIQVYDANINKIGQASLEVHLNNFLKAKNQDSSDEQIYLDHMTHTTFEFGYGLTRYLELGAYLQNGIDSNMTDHFGGTKIRTKFVYPNDLASFYNYGINFEIGYSPHEFSNEEWEMEVRPIFTFNKERWSLSFNPILDLPLSGNVHIPEFEPAFKLAYDIFTGWSFGAEYYAGFGKIDNLQFGGESEQYAFITTDKVNGPIEFNLGIGWGLNSNSHPLIAKAIVGFDF